MPKPDAEAFTKSLFERFGFEAFFRKRTHEELRGEKDELLKVFTSLSDSFNLTLRSREQCFTRIRIVMTTIPDNHRFHSYLLTILILLRAAAPDIYRRYAIEGGNVREVMDYLRSESGGALLDTPTFAYTMEAHLIAAKICMFDDLEKVAEFKEYRNVINDTSKTQTEIGRAQYIVNLVERFSNSIHPYMTPLLNFTVNKIELAAQFK